MICEKCGGTINYSSIIGDYLCSSCGFGAEDMNIIDISFKKHGLAKALSNLCPYPFVFEEFYCYSIESFIQSLRVKDEVIQKEVCLKTSTFNYSIRDVLGDWRSDGFVYWKGRKISRLSDEYLYLLQRAYIHMYKQNALFRHALSLSNNYVLIHSIGKKDEEDTLLTEGEYISILNMIKNSCLN